MTARFMTRTLAAGALLSAMHASAATIPLVNADFTADGWTNEEQFIQNTGTAGVVTGWSPTGLVRAYSLNLDGDGDPTIANAGQARVWGGWQAGDGLVQIGFQKFVESPNSLSQDVGSFVAGQEYTFSINIAPGFEGGNQPGFVQIRRASDDTLLAETTFTATVAGNSTSSTQSVSHIATVADAGSAIRVVFGTDTSVEGSGTVVFDNPVLVPEPASLALLGLGGLLVARRRRG